MGNCESNQAYIATDTPQPLVFTAVYQLSTAPGAAAGTGAPSRGSPRMTLSLRDQAKRNRVINQELENEKRLRDSTIKLLLLGAGESGKSTILKQMKIIHDNGFSTDDLKSKRIMVYANVLQSIRAVLEAMYKLDIHLHSVGARDVASEVNELVLTNNDAKPFSAELQKGIRILLADKGFEAAMSRHSEYALPDSAMHFIESFERICHQDYVPTQQDILLLRVATMGVIEVQFKIKSKVWRVFDVGGQRSQRKKWIHCFDDVRALIFVSALSEYDQVLAEDNITNRMRESLQLFDQVCNNKYFVETGIILFLNKKDLFAEKIGRVSSLRVAFPEYTGSDDYETASKYIQTKFFNANQVPNKSIYAHHTCATDTEQVQFVLDSVLDTILSAKLKGCGLY
uniref:Guanine nucleotide-binding protein G(O) subunit alpha n=1 Tax=Panagrellus redivivus TaxID=6233 RepID=A0A7E4UWS5_PANRE